MGKFVVLIFLVISTSIFGNVVDDGLKKVSILDRAYMKAFFDDAIQTDQIAHVLYFENKPVSIIAKTLKAKGRRFHDTLCLKGWRAFKKNEHLFPHPHFIFCESQVVFDKDFKVLHIYLINKEALETCLNKHLDIFKKTLNQEFHPKKFIESLEEGYALDADS